MSNEIFCTAFDKENGGLFTEIKGENESAVKI